MKRAVILICMLLCGWSLKAQEAAATQVAEMAAAMRSMGAYEVAFRIQVPEEGMQLAGTIAVDDDQYVIRMGDAEVYGDKTLRYEINHSRREVTLMSTEAESTNLLSNPAQAFELIAGYQARFVVNPKGERVVELTTPDDPLTKIFLSIDATTHRPTQIRYEMDGAGVDVELLRITPITKSLPRYDAARYEAYEMIDFR